MADPSFVNGVNVAPAAAPVRRPGVPITIPPTGAPSFRDVLRESAGAATPGTPLKFFAHAVQRLESRNITLSPADLSRMNAMADTAAAKAAKQSLFLMNDV